jgi:diguanylate cyclase (GGDEF)-like protein
LTPVFQSARCGTHNYSDTGGTDALTQVGNRKFLDDALLQEIERVKRYQRPLSIMMLDVDHFKKINDTLGHQTGDATLIELARIVRENTRQTDIVGRWGGEEFMVILPETPIEKTHLLADKLRKTVEHYAFSAAGKQTVSLGIAQLQDGESLERLIHRTDLALYQAKDKGRNRVGSA